MPLLPNIKKTEMYIENMLRSTFIRVTDSAITHDFCLCIVRPYSQAQCRGSIVHNGHPCISECHMHAVKH